MQENQRLQDKGRVNAIFVKSCSFRFAARCGKQESDK